MKAKKWLAVLAVLCMMLTLIPAFSLMASAASVDLPARPADATNWVLDSNTTVTSNGTWDKEANLMTAPGNGANMTVAPPAQVLEEDLVISFTLDRDMMYTWPLTRVYLADNLFVDICTGVTLSATYNGEAVFSKVETDGLPGWWNAFQYGDGQSFSFYLHEEADGTKTLEIFVGTTNVGSVVELTLTNPKISFQHGNECWGDTIYIRNVDIYCPNGDPYIPPTVPAKEDTETNWITSDKVSVALLNDNCTFDKDTLTLNLKLASATGNNGSAIFGIPSQVLAEDFVISYNLNTANGWWSSNHNVQLADDLVVKVGKAWNEGALQINDEKFDISMLGSYDWIQQWGAGTKVVIYVHDYKEGSDKKAVDVYLNDVYIGSKTGIAFTNPTLKFFNDTPQDGDYGKYTNLMMYSPNGDPEIPDPIPTYTVTVEDMTGGTVTGAPTEAVEYGTKVTLTAAAAEGYTFKYWMVNNRTYTDATLNLTVVDDVTVAPVYVADEATDYTLTYRSKDGRVVALRSLNGLLDGVASVPAVPARIGYTNGRWETVVLEEITSDIDVYALYDHETTTYAINVTGGTTNKEAAMFEERVTVTATVENFSAWTVDGVIVSTDATYSFYATDSVEITAVANLADATAVTAPTVKGVLNADDNSKFRMSVIVNTHVAEGYTFVEAGILYSINTSELAIGADGVKKKVSTVTADGTFMYSLNNAPSTSTIYVCGYVVVADAEGNLSTVTGTTISYNHTV